MPDDGCRIPGQRLDGVAQQVETLLPLIRREASCHRDGVGSTMIVGRRPAQSGRDAVDPSAVRRARAESAGGVATAVAMRDRIQRQQRHRTSSLRGTDIFCYGPAHRRPKMPGPASTPAVCWRSRSVPAGRIGVRRPHRVRNRIDVERHSGERISVGGGQAHRRVRTSLEPTPRERPYRRQQRRRAKGTIERNFAKQ